MLPCRAESKGSSQKHHRSQGLPLPASQEQLKPSSYRKSSLTTQPSLSLFCKKPLPVKASFPFPKRKLRLTKAMRHVLGHPTWRKTEAEASIGRTSSLGSSQ